MLNKILDAINNKPLAKFTIYFGAIIFFSFTAYSPLFNIYFADHDSMHMAIRYQEGIEPFFEWIKAMSIKHSRAYYFFLFPFISLVYSVKSFLGYKIITILFLISNLAIASYTLRYFFPRNKFHYIFPVLFLSLQSITTNHSLFTGYFPIYHTYWNFLLLSFVFFSKYTLNKTRLNLCIFTIFYASAMLLTEVTLVYSIFFLVIAKVRCNKLFLKDLTKKLKENKLIVISIILIILAYLFSHLYMRQVHPTKYIGNKFNINKVTLDGYIRTVIGYSIFNSPSVHILDKKFQNMYKELSLLNKKDFTILNDLQQVFKAHWFFKVLALICVLYFLIVYKDESIESESFKYLCLISIFLIFIPNMLHALNPHYQEFFIEGKRRTTHMGYLSRHGVIFFIMILSTIRIYRKRIFIIPILILTGIQSIQTEYNNFYVSKAQLKNKAKWDALEYLNENSYFENISCLYSPYLFEIQKVPYYSLKKFDNSHLVRLKSDKKNYWERFIKLKFNKNINVLKSLSSENNQCLTFNIKYNKDISTIELNINNISNKSNKVVNLL